MTPIELAARAVLGLEPGVTVRLRPVRPQDLIWEGVNEVDVWISLDFDSRSNPRPAVVDQLPVDWFWCGRFEWALALSTAASKVPAPPPPAVTRKRRVRMVRADKRTEEVRV